MTARLGAYEVTGTIGSGGLGTVLRGRAPDGRDVAIKLLRRPDGAGAVERFARERRLQGALGEADGFVPLLDHGESVSGPFVVMPLIEGGTLADRLRREGPMPLEEALDLGETLAAALGRAHDRGIVHRDLKPDNVLLRGDGRAFVADLGLAKHFLRATPDAALSRTLSQDGSFRGTIGYAAPEQMIDAKLVGPPADVFSLAAIIHECLTGKRAFAGDPLESCRRVEAGQVEPLGRAVPAPVRRVLAQALERDPEARPQDGAALAAALRDARRPVRARPVVIALAAALGASLALAQAAVAHAAARGLAEAERAAGRLDANALVMQARACLLAQDGEGALAVADAALTLAPDDARAHSLRAGALLLLGRRDEVVASCRRILELPGVGARVLTDAAGMCLQVDEAELGLEAATRALALDPRAGKSFAVRADALVRLGRHAEALAAAEAGLRVAPGFHLLLVLRVSALLELDPAAAAAECSRAALRDPANALWPTLRARALVASGDLPGAIAAYTDALALEPRSTTLLASRGQLHLRRRELALAERDFEALTAIAPDDFEGWRGLADARLPREDWVGAEAALTRALAVRPDHAPSWMWRADARRHLGRLDLAIDDATRAIELAPEDGSTWNGRAAYHMERNDFARAEEDLERALKIEPDLGVGWLNLARVRLARAELEASLEAIERAVALMPQRWEVYLTRAQGQARLGRRDAALRDLERARQLTRDPREVAEIDEGFRILGARPPG